MTANRLRWGALAWVLTLQFFVAETAVALQQETYSWSDDVISVLGASTSAASQGMNASFVLQGALVLGGALALRPLLRGTPGRAAVLLLGAASLGTLLVGVFPLDGNATAHQVGAGLYFVGSTLGLVAVAYGVRRRSEVVGSLLAALGVVGAAATVFFFAGITSLLGPGGTERVAAYVLPVGLALAGVTLWRRGGDPAADADRDRGPRAAVDRQAADPAQDADAARHAHDAPDAQDAQDVDDPWSTPVRRGD